MVSKRETAEVILLGYRIERQNTTLKNKALPCLREMGYGEKVCAQRF